MELDETTPELEQDELDQNGELLPDREAMSIVSPTEPITGIPDLHPQTGPPPEPST